MQGSAGSFVACSEKRMSRRQHCRKVQGSAGSYVTCSERRMSRRQHCWKVQGSAGSDVGYSRRGEVEGSTLEDARQRRQLCRMF
ncbi:unnamed protein product [Prunus armeniaca]